MPLPIKPIQLYTLSTPNGQKVAIFCEELKAAYPSFNYQSTKIDFRKGVQKADWYREINPNSRVPAIVDPNRDDFAVFETAAILLYLETHYDPLHKFSISSDSPDRDDFMSEVLQCISLVHGGVGPMQGWSAYMFPGQKPEPPEPIQDVIKRYQDDTRRLYDILEIQLTERDWLVGSGKGTFSLADVNALPWILCSPFVGISRSELPSSIKAWLERTLAREAVIKGLFDSPINEDMLKKSIAGELLVESKL